MYTLLNLAAVYTPSAGYIPFIVSAAKQGGCQKGSCFIHCPAPRSDDQPGMRKAASAGLFFDLIYLPEVFQSISPPFYLLLIL
jgi:hypothetical protein